MFGTTKRGNQKPGQKRHRLPLVRHSPAFSLFTYACVRDERYGNREAIERVSFIKGKLFPLPTPAGARGIMRWRRAHVPIANSHGGRHVTVCRECAALYRIAASVARHGRWTGSRLARRRRRDRARPSEICRALSESAQAGAGCDWFASGLDVVLVAVLSGD